jgi:hypothetical protein
MKKKRKKKMKKEEEEDSEKDKEEADMRRFVIFKLTRIQECQMWRRRRLLTTCVSNG